MRVPARFTLLATCLATAATLVSPASAPALDNGLARTPYLGWNTYYGLGAAFDDQTLRAEADAIVDRGLKAAGYEYVWIDGGWWTGTRDDAGEITVDARQWPNGMKAVADYIHSKGLKAGIYTDAGRDGCGGPTQGSYGHYQQDADRFAAWGFDAVKVDFCGGTNMHLDPAQAYREMRDALLHNASGRPLLFNICNPFRPGAAGNGYPPLERSAWWSYTFGPTTGNSWRTDTDVGFVHSIQFSDVLRNLDTDAQHPEAAGPGHWNDPDYLGPELGMTSDQARAQFTLWSMVAAPLVVGSDVRSLSDATIAMLTDRDVLAIDQDPLGRQGRAIDRQGDGEVWVRPLANGDRAVALLNRGDAPLMIATTAQAAGLPRAARYALRDLWGRRTTSSAGRIAATVDPGAATLFRVSVQKGGGLPPATSLTSPGLDSAGPVTVLVPGRSTRVTATFSNDSRDPLSDVRLRLDAPAGWSVSEQSSGATTLPGGRQLTATWTLTPADGALPGRVRLNTLVTFRSESGDAESRTSGVSALVPSAPPSDGGPLSQHGWLGTATSGWQVAAVDVSVGGNPIAIRGVHYDHGIGVASPSHVDYFLGGNCTRLTATAGIDDAVDAVGPEGGTATFAILGDGRRLYESGVVDRTAPRAVDLDVTGVQQLRLEVADAGDGGYNDRADWAGLQVTCGGIPAGPWPSFAPGASMGATASSAHDGYGPEKAIDGSLTTLWHSEFQPALPLPQSVTLDLGAQRTVTGVTYQPRLDVYATGTITGYTLQASSDGTTFADIASGDWPDDRELKSATLAAPRSTRYLRLVADRGDGGYASAAEIGVAVR